ncbi:MAG TPA: hypothetical protein VF786_03980 [Terriglobales bacterium]
MSLIDIKKIKDEAAKEVADEAATRAKSKLKAQMKAVETAREVLRGEEKKLEDLEQQIADGTF